MRFVDAAGFVSDDAWSALDLAEIDGVTVRVHWTERPYRWHVNDGSEVFVVVDGAVDMRYRVGGEEHVEGAHPGPGVCG